MAIGAYGPLIYWCRGFTLFPGFLVVFLCRGCFRFCVRDFRVFRVSGLGFRVFRCLGVQGLGLAKLRLSGVRG